MRKSSEIRSAMQNGSSLFAKSLQNSESESLETDSSYCALLDNNLPPGTIALTMHRASSRPNIIDTSTHSDKYSRYNGSSLILEEVIDEPIIPRDNDKSDNSLSRRMAFYKNNSRKIFSNLLLLQLVLIASFLIQINTSASSEVSSFQQQQQQQQQFSTFGGLSSTNSNSNNNANLNGVFNTGPSGFNTQQQQLSTTPSTISSFTSSSLSSSSSIPSVLTAYFIAGLANEIRNINSTAMMILSRGEPFQLQFRTACPFGNVVYDDKFAISINSRGNMTYTIKPNAFPWSVYHSVADGQWHSITFTGSLISLDDHDIHPHLSEEGKSPVINWDTNSSAENDQLKLNHMLHFFDGFVGCIRVPKPTHDHPVGREQHDLQSHEESFNEPESPSEHRMISLLDLFQLRGVSPFTPCNDTSIDLSTIHPCFEPETFVLCSKCQNGATCQPDPDNQMNNQCVCPPSTDEIEYIGPYCEIPQGLQLVDEVPNQVSSETEHLLDLGEDSSAPISSPSNIDSTSAVVNANDSSSSRMSLSVSSPIENVITTTTTETPEVSFSLTDGCPCHSNGICTPSSITVGQHFCNCSGTGYEGSYCESDVDECKLVPKKCKNGLCVNKNGTYSCFCTPGFAGKHCETYINFCLSNPCHNNATCHHLVNDYQCECQPGYDGADCEHDINECQSSPCENGATCLDELNDFTCHCQSGYQGKRCESDIDECASNPCQNQGNCIDLVNGFECDCNDTGFIGQLCENNVDDCKVDSCKNGGTCIDGIKGYNCSCYPGYEGHDCENDIDECGLVPCKNGDCHEKSNQTLYELPYESKLRQLLSSEFNYENAAGYVCICQEGFEGENCETDIDECIRAGNPCGKDGDCKDGIASYQCDCHKGFTGTHCEVEIDECEANPCVNGKCKDKVGDFECECPDGYGSKNCSVPLTGCLRNPCSTNGKCEPTYDESTNKHNFKCDCNSGFAGEKCQLKTTMSFNGSGPVEIKNNDRPFEIGNYELLFRFRTTLPDVLLVLGQGLTYFSLILSGGKLNLQSSLLNNLKGISSGTNLSNAEWHKVWISVNDSHIALAADSEQTIYPISEGQDVHTGFNVTILGGATAPLGFLNKRGLSPFIGCMQDIIINGERIIPGENLNASTVEVGCKRRDQCFPNPCENSGICTDLWQNFTCNCQRPYLGDRCQHEYTAATFHHESTSDSLAIVDVSSDIAHKFASTFDISMFVRTRNRNGTIFLLGHEVNGNYSVFLEAEIGEVGNLVIQAKWTDGIEDTNSRPETYAVDGLQITDGSSHLISIQRDKTLVKISVNGTEHFRKSVSNKVKFYPTVIYIGGKPSFPDVALEQTEDASAAASLETSGTGEDSATNNPDIQADVPIKQPLSNLRALKENDNFVVTRPFKGVIQDVRVNFSSTEATPQGVFGHGVHTKGQNYYVVEFFPLAINATYAMGDPLGNVTIQNLLEGTESDDTCKVNPCLNDGVCEVTWNDFHCKCADGYDGKVCEVLLHCAIVKCPRGSFCRNIEWSGFECVAEAAFDGKGTVSPHYHLETTELENITFNEASFRFRTKQTGNVLYLANGSRSFRIGLEVELDSHQNQSYDAVAIYIDGDRHTTRIPKMLDGQWHSIVTKFMVNENGPLRVLIDDKDQVVTPAIESISSFFLHDLVVNPSTEIIVGSQVEQRDRYNVDHADVNGNHIGHPEDAHNRFYRGCLADIKIGEYRLPFVTPSQLEAINHENTTLVRRTAPTAFYIEESIPGSAPQPHLGCILCYDEECRNDGRCDNAAEKYECSCVKGFDGDHCENNVDECLENECRFGSTCEDQIANYTCMCPPGYQGWRCDIDINECSLEYGMDPCKNGGTCVDGIARFTCECTDEFFGPNCEKRKRSSCKDDPCENGATCRDRESQYPNDVTFECRCAQGYEGETCAEQIDHCENIFCANGGSCENKLVGYECHCLAGYDGPKCEQDVNECSSNPCLHNGTCIDLVNNYSCDCGHTAYEGTHCEIDINECEIAGACPIMQRCENTIGSYKCVCPDTTMCGDNCDIRDPCYEEGNKTCHNGGSCTSLCHDEDSKLWKCECTENYGGEFCQLLTMAQPDKAIDVLLIIIPIIAAMLIAATIGVVMAVRMARKKRATRGVYSPSQQEYCNPRVELDNVMKPPPEERLI